MALKKDVSRTTAVLTAEDIATIVGLRGVEHILDELIEDL